MPWKVALNDMTHVKILGKNSYLLILLAVVMFIVKNGLM